MSVATVESALDGLVARFLELTRSSHGRLPRLAHDPAWPSPCLHGTPDADGLVAWQPLRRTEPPDFSGLAAALERPLPAAWEAYFGRYWSETLPTGGLYGRVELLQLWNPEDQERLVANQLGHVLQRRRRGQSPSLFFACADDPDQLYSVDLDSGAVLREQLSRGTQRELAASLADFLAGLKALAGD